MDENKRDARLDFFEVTECIERTIALRDEIRWGADRKIFLSANKEKEVKSACNEVLMLLSKVNQILRHQLVPIMDVSTVDAFEENLKEIMQDINYVELYTSPDFQCDQTGGFPTSLRVSWEKNKAWLVLNDSLIEEGQDVSECEYQCAKFGIRECHDVEQYNSILKELGGEAYEEAALEIEEGMEMRQ